MTVNRLVSALQDDGWSVESPTEDTIQAVRPARPLMPTSEGDLDGHPIPEQRFTLVTDAAALDGYQQLLGESGRSVFGSDLSRNEANFRLMLVHLEEAVATNPVGTTFRFDRDSIAVVPRVV